MFDDILNKGTCSEYDYIQHKELFDKAVEDKIISTPQKYQKSQLTSGAGIETRYEYSWDVLKEVK